MPPWNTPWNPPWTAPELAPHARAILRANGLAAALALPGVAASLTLTPGWVGACLALMPGVGLAALLNARPGGAWIRNLTLFGLAAGLAELAADAWLVHGTQTLVYPPDEPKLWASPVYMPIAWFGILGVGYSAVILAGRRLSRAATALVTAACLGLYIPLYEAIAAAARWWHYVQTPMLGPVPHFIALGEVLLALPLPWIVAHLTRCGPGQALGHGVAQGAWIGVSYGVAFGLVG